MQLLVGLGNPGYEYSKSRHNLGFRVIDKLAQFAKVEFSPGKGQFWIARAKIEDNEFAMLKPTTYMNNSGIAVKDFIEQHRIILQDMLVVCDDFQLPLGVIRIRRGGSDGGHKGLGSIIYNLCTEQFPRLRCGIASEFMPNSKMGSSDFVLSNFEEKELPIVEKMILRARDACITFITKGVEKAMNKFNYFNKDEIN